MRIHRTLRDATGKNVDVTVEIDESGDNLERAIMRLANKARTSRTGTVTALDGAVRVTIERTP